MIFTVSGELRKIVDAENRKRMKDYEAGGFGGGDGVISKANFRSVWNQKLCGSLGELGVAEFLGCRETTLQAFDLVEWYVARFGTLADTAWNIDIPEASSEVKATFYRSGRLCVPEAHTNRRGLGVYYWCVRLVQTEPVSNDVEIVGWLEGDVALQEHKKRAFKNQEGYWTEPEKLHPPETFPITGFVPASLLKERERRVKTRTL